MRFLSSLGCFSQPSTPPPPPPRPVTGQGVVPGHLSINMCLWRQRYDIAVQNCTLLLKRQKYFPPGRVNSLLRLKYSRPRSNLPQAEAFPARKNNSILGQWYSGIPVWGRELLMNILAVYVLYRRCGDVLSTSAISFLSNKTNKVRGMPTCFRQRKIFVFQCLSRHLLQIFSSNAFSERK